MLRLNPLIDLHWRDWGADSVAMEAMSGEVHRIDPLSAALLACFEAGARTEAQAKAQLLADLGDDGNAAVLGALDAAVCRFRHLGWLLDGDG